MSAKVESRSQMTQRGRSMAMGGGGGGGTRIPVAVRSTPPSLPPVTSSPSSSSSSSPSHSTLPTLSQQPPPPQQSRTAVVPSVQDHSSKADPLLPKPSSQPQQPPSPPSTNTTVPSSSSSEKLALPSIPPQQAVASLQLQPPPPQPSSQSSSSSPSSSQPLPPEPSSSSSNSWHLPLVEPSAPPSSVPSEVESGAHDGWKQARLKEGGPAVWTPEKEELPATRDGPPPEDRLSGANAARPPPTPAPVSLPAVAAKTEAQTSSKPEVMSVTVRASLQPRVYREGMQYMRDRIAQITTDLDRIQCQYHLTDSVDEDLFVDYLKTCDRHFLRANTQLRKRSVKLEVIDSETRLVALLNKLREDDSFDPETVRYLTEYWESVKNAVEGLNGVVSKFQSNVLNRLKRNYITDSSGAGGGEASTALDVCSGFTADISTFMTDLENKLSNTRILLKSFHSGLHQHLFEQTRFSDLLVVSCDLKAFPLLRLVADVAGKVGGMCEVAHRWLVRDEHFMQEIQSFIREARQRTRRREEDLKSQKEKQKKYEKSAKAAHILLQNNRDKLRRIETELHVLEEQVNESARDKQQRYDLLQQKESMVDFLQITLSQTQAQARNRNNYTLQATRLKMSRQVKGLKEVLSSMERDLDAIQTEIHVKAEEKVRLSEKVEHHEKSYDALRADMDRFSSCMEQLQREVTDLSGQLLQLEIIHNLKTSPEKVEEIYDRPSTVKLAPSLREKIKERSRRGRVKPK